MFNFRFFITITIQHSLFIQICVSVCSQYKSTFSWYICSFKCIYLQWILHQNSYIRCLSVLTRLTIHTSFRSLGCVCWTYGCLSHTVVGSSIGKRVHWVCHPRSLTVSVPLSLLAGSHPPSYLSGYFGAYLFTGSSLIPSWQLFGRFSSNPSDIG